MFLVDGQRVVMPEAFGESVNTFGGRRQYIAPGGLGLAKSYATYGQLYRAQLWIGAVVRKRANALARLPLRFPGEDGRLTSLFGATPGMNPFTLVRWIQATEDIYGEAMLLKVRVAGEVVALLPMHPTKTQVVVTVEGGEQHVEYWFQGHLGGAPLFKFAPSEVIHFKEYNPDELWRGMSALESLRETLANEDASRRATKSFWEQGARPGVVVEHPMQLSDDGIQRLRASVDAAHAGADNFGSTLVLEEGATARIIQLSSEEMQYIESRRLNREEVVAAYDTPPPVVHILDRATFCLPADALVMTERGSVPISEVTVTDRVWSLVNETLRSNRVSWSGQTGFKPLLTIRTQNRQLRCTDNHPLLVRRTVRAVRVGSRGAAYSHSLVWVPAGKLVVGDIIVTADELPEFGGDECPTRTVSEGFAEFCGLLLGDGNVSKPGHTGVSIARASTALYMDHYRQVIRDEFTQRDGDIVLQEYERATRFSSVTAGRELAALGLSGTAHTKTVPSWIFGLSSKLRAAFLRGFLDSDGSVDKNGRISYSSCNLTMLRQIRELCIGLGVPVTNMTHTVGTTTMPNGRLQPVDQWVFTCSDPGRNRIIGSHDARYQQRLAEATPFGEGKNLTYYAYAAHGRITLPPPNGCGYAKVVSIMIDETPVPVYDIEVEDSHNFIAEGVIVHNSNITEQMRSMYRDTMTPPIQLIEATLLDQLVKPDFPDLYEAGVMPTVDMSGVLRGDWETRVSAVASAVQNSLLTPAEGRKILDLDVIDDPNADELYANAALTRLDSPGRMTAGAGQPAPSPTSAPSAPSAPIPATIAPPAPKALPPAPASKSLRSIMGRLGSIKADKSQLRAALVAEHAKVLATHLGALPTVFDPNIHPAVALADDLLPLSQATVKTFGDLTAVTLGTTFDHAATLEVQAVMVANAAAKIIAAQRARIDAFEGADDEELVDPLSDDAVTATATRVADTQVTSTSSYANHAAATQAGAGSKTWITAGSNPRESHAALNGETVPIGDLFSNGLRWPGDSESDDADELAGCTCSVEFSTN